MKYNIQLEPAEAQQVLQALAAGPYNQVAQVIANIAQQMQTQDQPKESQK